MMLTYEKAHDINKLNNELMSLDFLKPIKGEHEEDGVTPIAFTKSAGNVIEIRVEKELTIEEVELIDNIIESHNNAPLPKPPNNKDRIDSLEEALTILMMEGF